MDAAAVNYVKPAASELLLAHCFALESDDRCIPTAAARLEALLGDAYGALNRKEEAIVAYVRSYKKAGTDEVLNYSLFEASKQMQKLGRWDDVGKLFTEFVAEKPDHPAVVAAMYWIAKARAKEGRGDEAKVLLVDNLKKYIAEPKREAVEQLLSQMAQLCSKRVRPPTAAPATDAPVGNARGSSSVPLMFRGTVAAASDPALTCALMRPERSLFGAMVTLPSAASEPDATFRSVMR